MSLTLLSGMIALWFAGSRLSAPVNSEIEAAPADLQARNVVLDGVQGWFVPSNENSHCLLLLHGIRADRRAMIERARFLKKAGYASLLIDLQAHGETPGKHITFGYLESGNAHAAVDYLRSRAPCKKIAALGISLGGAASLLGPEPLPVDAYILESVYSSIEDAVYNRLEIRVGKLAGLLAPLLYYQIPTRLDITLDELRPMTAITQVKAPVLIIAGSHDRHTTIANSRRLYANAPTAKQFWPIHQAGHNDLYHFTPAQYERTILTFLEKHFEVSQ